jgi:hypothetical protein
MVACMLHVVVMQSIKVRITQVCISCFPSCGLHHANTFSGPRVTRLDRRRETRDERQETRNEKRERRPAPCLCPKWTAEARVPHFWAGNGGLRAQEGGYLYGGRVVMNGRARSDEWSSFLALVSVCCAYYY